MKKAISIFLIFFLFLCSCDDGDDAGKKITPEGGTVVSYDELVTVTFPQGAVNEDLFISIIPLESSVLTSKPDFEFIGNAYNIIAKNKQGQIVNNYFHKNAEIAVIYHPDDVRGLTEEDFGIDYYDKAEDQWITMDSRVYPAVCKLTTTAGHPVEFAILAGTAPGTALRKIDLGVNPNKLRNLIPDTSEGMKNTPVIVLDDQNELKLNGITEDGSNIGFIHYRQKQTGTNC